MAVPQLNFIIGSIRGLECDGCILEVGVGGGATSVMVARDLMWQSRRRQFVAVDTFSGFTAEDVAFERQNRGKVDDYDFYRSNRRDWYIKTLIAHGVTDAIVFQDDAKAFDYASQAPIAFCLLDVDLYQPIKAALPRIYESLAPGGMIVVDDCAAEVSIYDGATQAYREFCAERGLQALVVHDKLGVIRKAT